MASDHLLFFFLRNTDLQKKINLLKQFYCALNNIDLFFFSNLNQFDNLKILNNSEIVFYVSKINYAPLKNVVILKFNVIQQ